MLFKDEIRAKLKYLERKICCVDTVTSVFSQDIIDALNAANVPDGTNPFATLDDLAMIAPGTTITVVANYSALPNPTTVSGEFYWTEAAEGTFWLPGSLGGTYYPAGIYYSNGVAWTYIQTPFNATQLEVDAGLNNDKFVTSLTFTNASKWNNYSTDIHANIAALDLVSGTNTGDETLISIQTKRPLKTVNGNSLEGVGDVVIAIATTDYSFSFLLMGG